MPKKAMPQRRMPKKMPKEHMMMSEASHKKAMKKMGKGYK